MTTPSGEFLVGARPTKGPATTVVSGLLAGAARGGP